MHLTLKVVRSPEVLVPEPRRVTETELSIGRGAENDWVLPDPNRHLSKRHCTLSLRAGRWSVTDRSSNGTFVNRDIQPLGDGQTRNLRDGDRLRIGLYEIEIRIVEEETLHGRHAAWVTQAAVDTPTHDPFGNDPLGERRPAHRPRDAMPPPTGPDATLPQEVASQAAPAVDQGAGHILETIGLTSPPMALAPAPDAAPGDGGLFAAFLRGAGMAGAQPPTDPVAAMEAMGATFAALVAGLREVMITRARIKSEFRIEQTLMRSQGNNPLKFSADDQDALAALLGIGRRIDMKPADAVAASLHDLQTHETATIAGMKAGLRAVLSRIEPDRLAASAEPAGPTGLSPEARARAWDLFARQHADIAASAPDDFDGIFGRAFARGYELALRDREPGSA